jgi:microcystin-dependent protein
MKNFFTAIFLFATITTQAQVGIGTNSPHASAQLDVTSTDKGALMPRLTESQRTGISSPAAGLLVYQTDGASGFYYYTGSAWTNLTTGGTGGVPSGTIMAYAGTTAPSGWVLCSGAAISRSTNAALFAAIGTTYGAGDGSTTFNLPDLRGRTIFGLDNMGGTAANRLTTAGGLSADNTLGATGGNQTVTLSTNNLPSHNHSFTGTSVTTSSNSHYHTYLDAYFAENFSGGTGGNSRYGTSAGTDSDNSFYWRTNSNTHSSSPSSINTSTEAHTHTVTAAGTIGNTGNGTAFGVVNPALVLNYIIKL